MTGFDFSVPIGAQQAAQPGQSQAQTAQAQQIKLNMGEHLFVLGANGTGKSSLMLRFYSPHKEKARRIVSHRQNWFASGGVNMTARERSRVGNDISIQDMQPESRWREHYSDKRANMAIYDLIDAENIRAREIAVAADANDMQRVETLAAKHSPLSKVNSLFQLCNLPLSLSIEPGQQVMASRVGGPKYDVAEMSDGERNALMIASNVLTVPPGTLLIIDEPERHLHRSIISPLLSLLFMERPDCAFIVSTHDVMLAIDNPDGQKLLVRGCTHGVNKNILAWDVDLVASGGAIDDQIMQDVLGSRRTVIFVEGAKTSLDLPLYAAIFPSISVIPKQTCVDVQNAVKGLRNSADAHWVKAYGVVDGDARPPDDLAALQQAGIYAVKAYSIEAIYYHPEVQMRIAKLQVDVLGGDPNDLIAAATTATISSVRPHIDRLASRVVEKDVRDRVLKLIPSHQELAATPRFDLILNVSDLMTAEKDRLNTACANSDVEEIICRYPVRETPALTEIAKALRFQSRSDYESAVRKLLATDPSAVEFVRGLFGTMHRDVCLH